jgi:tyrosyl-tRNA synthetase
MEEVEELASLKDENINRAKEVLAYEVTKLVHGEEEAVKARDGAKAAFGGGLGLENIPTTRIPAAEFEGEGIGLVTLIHRVGLVTSKSEARRAIEQGGIMLGDIKTASADFIVTTGNFTDGKLVIKKGKKTFHMVELYDGTSDKG